MSERAPAAPERVAEIRWIAVSRLDLPADNVWVDPERLRGAGLTRTGGGGAPPLEELAASIRAHGVLEPLLVSPYELGRRGCYLVVAGSRRLLAARMAGLGEVPCWVRQVSDKERIELMLIENLHRRRLSSLEEAHAYARLLEQNGYSQRELGQRVGVSAAKISRRLLLLQLDKKTQRLVAEGKLSEGRALGYHDGGPAANVFEADEALHVAWTRLREDVLEFGDATLQRRMAEFGKAFTRYFELLGKERAPARA